MNICIWGTKQKAHYFLENLDGDVANVNYITDGKKCGHTLQGIKVCSPTEVEWRSIDYTVICSEAYGEIHKSLKDEYGVSVDRIIAGYYSFYEEIEEFVNSSLYNLLSERGKLAFIEKINDHAVMRKYEKEKSHIIKKLETLEENSELYPLSVYDRRVDPEIEFAGSLLDYVVKKYNLTIVYRNCFGYKSAIGLPCSMKLMIQYGFATDCYPLLAFIDKFYRDKIRMAIDIGANIGVVTGYLRSIGATVHSFEPSEEVSTVAKEYLTISGYMDKKCVWNICGCGDENTQKEYYDFGQTQSGHNSFEFYSDYSDARSVKSYKATMVTLDEYCSEKNISSIDFVKIDTEGYEYRVLKGMKKLLSKGAIKLIAFEHSPSCLDSSKEAQMVTLLKENGYSFVDLHHNPVNDEDILNTTSHQDFIAIQGVAE